MRDFWKWGCDPLTGQPATLFKSFEALCDSWMEFLCSQVLDVILSKSQVLLRARGSNCLLGKPLTWNGFISLIWHSFPLQFWTYNLIAKSLNFLICMLSRDNSASLHSSISRRRCTQICLAKQRPCCLRRAQSLHTISSGVLSSVCRGSQKDFQQLITNFLDCLEAGR